MGTDGNDGRPPSEGNEPVGRDAAGRLGKPADGRDGSPTAGVDTLGTPAEGKDGRLRAGAGTLGTVGTTGLVIWNNTKRFSAPQH